ncbi:MAG TPA: hypothetical protein VFZ97_09830 [Acidimicrobiales bacterium]
MSELRTHPAGNLNDTPNKSTLGPLEAASVVDSGTVVSRVAVVEADVTVVVEPADVLLGDAVQADNPVSASEQAIAVAAPTRDRAKETPAPTITTIDISHHTRRFLRPNRNQNRTRTELLITRSAPRLPLRSSRPRRVRNDSYLPSAYRRIRSGSGRTAGGS